jgi:hypothetical protein
MPRKPALDKFKGVLFDNMDEIETLTPAERNQLKRYRFCFTESLENPSLSDRELRDFLMEEFGISQTQAYVDISNVRILLGNVRNAGKEWVRYLVTEELKEAIKEAKAAGPKKLMERIVAIDKLAKYHRLDKEDAVEMPWDEIIPQPIEPTTDPRVIGGKPLENKEEEIRKLYEKYKGEIEIEDIDYEVVKDGKA